MRAPFALALASALAAPAALANAGDIWSGSYLAPEYVRVAPVEVQAVEVTRVEPADNVVVYEDRVIRGEPVIVEESYAYAWPTEILNRPGYPDLSGYPDRTSALNPQTGQLIDYGLFNRRGPNDFGGNG